MDPVFSSCMRSGSACQRTAQVYLGLDMELGQLMAVKQLNLSHMGPSSRASEHEAAVRRVEKEVNFYRRLSHPHIVRYLVRSDVIGQGLVFSTADPPGGPTTSAQGLKEEKGVSCTSATPALSQLPADGLSSHDSGPLSPRMIGEGSMDRRRV